MIQEEKPRLSKLIQEAALSAVSGHPSAACMALEQLLENESSSLSPKEQARVRRVLELTGERGLSRAKTAPKQALGTLKEASTEHELLREVAWPKISIVTPTYSQGQFIEDTILSIINQNYPNLEYIIMDGGSPDNTLDIIKKYKDRITCVVSEPDKGQSNAINKGMRLTTGDILYWLNSDDMLEPNTLLYVGLCFLEQGFDLLVGTCTPFDNDCGELNNRHMATMPFGLRIEDITDIKATWLKGMYFHQPEVFFSRRLWEAAGGYVDEDLYFSMDYDLWARMALVSDFQARVRTVGKSFCLYREHSNQKTSTVEAYLPELLSHSEVIRERNLVSVVRGDFSTTKDYRQKLSIVCFSDFGFHGGAGVAHKRVCQVLQAAGHDVMQLSGFQHWQSETLDQTVESFSEALEILQPDLVLLGNLHNLKRGLEIAEHCTRHFPTIAIAHDFWWLTGRCAYTHGCHYLFTRCSNVCPTPQEYPRLDPLVIHVHHQRKKQLLQNPNFYVLANSSYTQSVYSQAIKAWSVKTNPVGVVALPIVPEGDYELQFPERAPQGMNNWGKSTKIRIVLGCTDHADFRKGADLAVLALHRLMAEHAEIQVDVYGKSSDLILDSLAEFSNRILMHGYLTSQEQYHELLESGDIFLGTSREETLGQTFIEAAHAGLITVGPMLSGYADVVRCCRYSLGYVGLEVATIVSTLELAVALVRQQDRNHIRSLQQAQARAGFSGMSFLSCINNYLYTSGLWKKIRYHGPTKIYDIKYNSLRIEEITLSEAQQTPNEKMPSEKLLTIVAHLHVDELKLGPGLYIEKVGTKSVAWLRKESTLILSCNKLEEIYKIVLNPHWIPENMRNTMVSMKVCGLGVLTACIPSREQSPIVFTFDDNVPRTSHLLTALLVSIHFQETAHLDDARKNLSIVLATVEMHGMALPSIESI